jgi:hypothetical protein
MAVLSNVAEAQMPGAPLGGLLTSPVVLREGPEPPPGAAEPIITVSLGDFVQSGFLVLVEPGAPDFRDPAFWSDVVIFDDPGRGVACAAPDSALYATMVSDAPGETGMTDADLAPTGITIAEILACPFTVFQVEGTRPDGLNEYFPTPDHLFIYQIYSDADQAPTDPTHYWSYGLADTISLPTPIAAQDQLYPGFRPVLLDTLKRLVNWVQKNNSAVRDTFIHYTWWNIKGKSPVGAVTDISNQFGSGRIYISNLEFMLAPAWKNTDFPNTPNANHYLCYRASGWRPPAAGFDMRDEWRGAVIIPDTLAYFCIPCAKRHGTAIYSIVDSVTHLAVYRITPQSELFYPFFKDQFIAGNFLVRQLPDEYLFVPSVKGQVVGVRPVPQVPLGLALGDPAPNPARLSATILYTLPRSMSVRLEVYDILGRRVRSLVKGSLDAGAHEATWDLRSGTGDRVRSGVYIVRLSVSGAQLSRRVVVTN